MATPTVIFIVLSTRYLDVLISPVPRRLRHVTRVGQYRLRYASRVDPVPYLCSIYVVLLVFMLRHSGRSSAGCDEPRRAGKHPRVSRYPGCVPVQRIRRPIAAC